MEEILTPKIPTTPTVKNCHKGQQWKVEKVAKVVMMVAVPLEACDTVVTMKREEQICR